MQDIQTLTVKDNSEELRNALLKPMTTLRNNLSKVPMSVLKTKYKQGYDALILKLRKAASEYATFLIFHDIQIHEKYLQECLREVEHLIKSSNIQKELSCAVYKTQDIIAFEHNALAFRKLLIREISTQYGERALISSDEKTTLSIYEYSKQKIHSTIVTLHKA